ncbi:mitochondrial ribosomal protein subunit S18 [Coprinopsis cinerea okayama7|uniref:Mitochondrial ribosomal protein subunit S18 n=1 Tax=Coprinopsis cinerea (strain Okayama-7 / 130 / ATCC MYA-4618 / FGSC 9003) TaxID=240176 RepID=A8NWN3_COPC7|nr:mitochondrial 37S ribosomal protein YmS18 [Coprinopsis cinerea okayama7\|eukprot:XP_001836940.2 mitochondrial 37S ribosomal protein YmS18 [Coprinopsis cinerea okayama7\
MFNALRACSRQPSSSPWVTQLRYTSMKRSGSPLATALSKAHGIAPKRPTRQPTAEPPQAGEDGYAKPVPQQQETTRKKEEVRLRLHCHSSPNNTITTLTKQDGSTIAWFSGGSCGFKKGNRATYEAGYQCAVRSFRKIEEIKNQIVSESKKNVVVDLFFKGFGQGRDALRGALLATEGEQIRPLVATITDRTPIKIGGTRAKKMPRL